MAVVTVQLFDKRGKADHFDVLTRDQKAVHTCQQIGCM